MASRATDGNADERNGVQAVETGLQVLSAFIGAEPMPMLKTLAERANMHPAKVHRYLVSLCRMGYVEQDAVTGRYRLAGWSLRLGFAAMNSVDVLGVARPLLPGFCQSLGQTVVLAVWSTGGPTVAIREAVPGPISITASIGSILPMLRSSTGRAFAAWLPRGRTAALLKEELAWLRANPQSGCPTSMAEAEALFEDVRRHGLARVTGQLNAAVHALSAPVYDSAGDIVAVLSAVGAAGQIDSTWTGPVARTLLQSAATVSRGLGHLPD